METTQAQDKQTRILNTMLDLVAERGFHGTPMSQVARRSGVSTGIIYHYFAGKDDLIHGLYRHVKTQFGEALIQGEPQTLTWPQNMQRVWLNAFDFYVAHPKATVFLEQYDNSPYARDWHQEDLDDNMRQLMAMLTTLITDGVVREMPPVVFYELTIGVALGLAKRQIGGTVALSRAELEEIALTCCRAITAE